MRALLISSVAACALVTGLAGAAPGVPNRGSKGTDQECVWYKGQEYMFTFPGTPSRTAQWFGGDPGAPQAVNGGHSLFYNRPYNTAETSDVYVVVPGAQHIPPAPPGQPAFPPHDHLVDVLPGDAGYNGFFDLKFFFDPVLIGISPPPSTFIPGSVRSVADAFQAVADGSLIGPLTPLEAHLPGIETEEDLFVLHVPATGYRPCRH